MAGNGAIAGLVAITAPSGYVDPWAAPSSASSPASIVVAGVLAIDKNIDDPVGALSAHGMAGIWGTLVLRPVHGAGLAEIRRRQGRPLLRRLASPAGGPVSRRRRGLRVRVHRVVRHLLADQDRPSAFASARRKRTPVSTSPSTACTGTRSSSSRRRSSSATVVRPGTPLRYHSRPRPRLARCPAEEDRGVHPPRGVRADPHGAPRARLPSLTICEVKAPAARTASPSTTAAPS